MGQLSYVRIDATKKARSSTEAPPIGERFFLVVDRHLYSLLHQRDVAYNHVISCVLPDYSWTHVIMDRFRWYFSPIVMIFDIVVTIN